MKRLSLSRWLSFSLALAGTTATLTFDVRAASQPAKLDFNRDIRPILSDNCFACHGPDAKALKGGLRIDLRDSVTKPAKSDKIAVVPGHPETSELIKRITTTDEDDHMPPAKSGKKLAAGQVELLRRWIKEGAEYHQHWAYVPPKAVEPPVVKNSKWPRNGIDNFILARLEQEKLKPAPEADRPALIRRVTLDLTGLPPTPAEVDAFVKDTSPKAYEHVVDRLLASPRFGERMTLDWLDAARYGDTHGYHIDSAREMTRWRDGVIKAFNENQPFDQFTIEQLAGDLLPNATLDQKIASGFNRNHMINFEGGAVADEYHTAYIKDRVNTTSTVWLGLTLTCAECHDHKYDPLTAKDYYSMYAFFNTVPENGLDGSGGNAVPMLQLPSPEQKAKLDDLKEVVVSREAALKSADQEVASAQTKWEAAIVAAPAESWEPAGLQLRFPLNESLEGTDANGNKIDATLAHPDGPKWSDGRLGKGIKLEGSEKSFVSSSTNLNFDEKTPFSYGIWVKHSGREGALIAKMDEGKQLRGFDLLMTDGKIWVHLINAWPESAIRVVTKESVPRDRWAHVFATYDGSGKAAGVTIYLNGKAAGIEVKEDKLSGTILNDTSLNLGKRSASYSFKGSLEDARFYNRQLTADEVGRLAEAPFVALARIEADKRTDDQKNDLRNYYRRRYSPEWVKADDALSLARKERDDYNRKIPTTMIMGEMEKPRDTFVLVRGQYDKKGEKVTPATPVALPAMREGEAHNRLGLARWLVSPEQPLTARVTVNRYWQMYFGNGIVKSAENFGSQGDWPTHPELLDWLANQFTRSGWDVKGMQKLILMSATYRQSSAAPRKLVERDPENLLHARGPRIRLQAEFLRDQALAVSGLLNPKIGGETVFPYQPPGLWEELMVREDGDRFSAQKYVQSHGDALYRRSMYMFWKRTSPPASMSALDAPDRQTCVVRRQRTNTPLQALILMNDPTYVEAARKLAERMMTEAKSDRERVTLAYKLALARAPKSSELDTLIKLYREQLAVYRKNPEAAAKLLKVGEAEPNATLDSNELAAWAMVASTILNLDETVTKG